MRTQLPFLLLIWFGCYALGSISYSLLTLGECPEAALELKQQEAVARADLQRRGVNLDAR